MKNRTTGIEWCEHTWNFAVGCSIHTPGCTNCYAMQMAARIVAMGTTSVYDGTVRQANGRAVWTGKISRGSPSTWRKPLKIKRPSLIFVNSMSDFFHEDMPDEWRLEAMAIMRRTPHQYQVLTKRPENVAPFLARTGATLPENFWLGATIERGDFAHRIEALRQVDARIRFLSVEPLIGPIDEIEQVGLDGIHQVIGGGESGPGARRCEPDWARRLRDITVDAGVAFFWKQWGKWENNPQLRDLLCIRDAVKDWSVSDWLAQHDPQGKGGSLIDGRYWKELPPYQLPAWGVPSA